MKKNLYIILFITFIISCNEKKEKVINEKPVFRNQLETFNYSPPRPENATLKGAIVIGSSGFDAFVVSIDENDRWELRKAEYGRSYVINNEFSIEKIKNGILTYRKNMIDMGVQLENIHILISSSASKNKKLNGILDQISGEFTFKKVSEEEEALFAYKALVPGEFRDESFAVDMGSGNTKISWKQTDEIQTLDIIGSMYYLDSTFHENSDFDTLEEELKRIPKENTYHCFIIGGVPYELANKSEKYNDRYTVIKSLDSLKIENNDKLIAGIKILNSIKKITETRNFVFDWDCNFAIGYLLELD